MTTVTYNIPNISCGHCVHTIKMEVGDLAGVSTVDASAESKTATIEFDAPASEDAIKVLLAEINYPAK
ncbi:MAG: heavy-metal-associated domain-containing protein [Anaerolineae bacterium]|nr:heavy-metal-associated domain-containing protein [Anaerolineae bacterium]